MAVVLRCKSCGQKNRVPANHLTDTGRCGACKKPLPPVAEPISVDEQQFAEVAQNARVPVLVDFWAAWCGPCRIAAPHVARVAAKTAGRAIVVQVDTERYPALAARYNVRGIPNFMVLSGGNVVVQQAGVVDEATMERWLEQAQAA